MTDVIRRLFTASTLAAGLLIPPRPAPAQVYPADPQLAWAVLGVDVVSDVQHFAVSGYSFRDMKARLAREGPVSDDGVRGDALTSYDLRVASTLHASEDGCRVVRARTQLHVTIHLPDWVEEPHASDRDAVAWRVTIRHLAAHEARHRDAALRAAFRAVELVREQEARSCFVLGRRVEAIVAKVREELQRAQAEIDHR